MWKRVKAVIMFYLYAIGCVSTYVYGNTVKKSII